MLAVVLIIGVLPLTSAVLENTTIDQLETKLPGFFESFPRNCLRKRNDRWIVKKKCPGDPFKEDIGRKRRAVAGVKENWDCDFPIQACCRTCRRRIPMLRPIQIKQDKMAITVYPLFCPHKHYQLVDQVECLKNRCKKCKKQWTFYSFVVTNITTTGYEGYCETQGLDVWFVKTRIDSHCTCQRPRN